MAFRFKSPGCIVISAVTLGLLAFISLILLSLAINETSSGVDVQCSPGTIFKTTHEFASGTRLLIDDWFLLANFTCDVEGETLWTVASALCPGNNATCYETSTFPCTFYPQQRDLECGVGQAGPDAGLKAALGFGIFLSLLVMLCSCGGVVLAKHMAAKRNYSLLSIGDEV